MRTVIECAACGKTITPALYLRDNFTLVMVIDSKCQQCEEQRDERLDHHREDK